MNGIEDAVRVLRAAGDASRLRILAALGERSLCVCELVSLVDVGQPAVSRHLSLLEAAGLVERLRDGRWVIYRLAEPAGSTFGAGVLREVRQCALRDPDATDFLEHARKVDRRTLRQFVVEPCSTAAAGDET